MLFAVAELLIVKRIVRLIACQITVADTLTSHNRQEQTYNCVVYERS